MTSYTRHKHVTWYIAWYTYCIVGNLQTTVRRSTWFASSRRRLSPLPRRRRRQVWRHDDVGPACRRRHHRRTTAVTTSWRPDGGPSASEIVASPCIQIFSFACRSPRTYVSVSACTREETVSSVVLVMKKRATSNPAICFLISIAECCKSARSFYRSNCWML